MFRYQPWHLQERLDECHRTARPLLRKRVSLERRLKSDGHSFPCFPPDPPKNPRLESLTIQSCAMAPTEPASSFEEQNCSRASAFVPGSSVPLVRNLCRGPS